MLEGSLEDDSTFYAYYLLDDDSEIDNPEMWVKSNPSIINEKGEGIISLSALKIDYAKACLVKADKINFITKNLNIFTDSIDAWIPDDDYKRCFNGVELDELLGGECFLGFDLSRTRDLSSLVAVVQHPKTGKLHVVPEFYFPTSENEENKIRPSGIDLTDWIDRGFIQPHNDRIVDEKKIFERIQWWCNNFDVKSIGYDPWHAIQLVEKVKEEIMVDMIPCKQNMAFFTFPMKFTERLIYSEQISMSESPVLRWNFGSAVLAIDGNAGCKVMKNKSLDSVDGVVAFLMALGMYANHNFDAVSAMFEELNNTITDNAVD